MQNFHPVEMHEVLEKKIIISADHLAKPDD